MPLPHVFASTRVSRPSALPYTMSSHICRVWVLSETHLLTVSHIHILFSVSPYLSTNSRRRHTLIYTPSPCCASHGPQTARRSTQLPRTPSRLPPATEASKKAVVVFARLL